jgi:predicted AAA+ superfamily ATPase
VARIFPRYSLPLVEVTLDHTPAVFIAGARQVGKSTLAREVVSRRGIPTSVSLDTRAVLEAARADPDAFIAGLDKPVFIDEVQRVPELLLAIKDDLERNRVNGRYLMTGSANILTTPKVADALTGRISLIRLWPLAQAEIEGARTNIVDMALAGDAPRITGAPIGRAAFVSRLVEGGYPALRSVPATTRRRLFNDYVNSTIVRDLREISDARKLDEVPRLLRRLGSQAANLYVPDNVSRDLRLTRPTVVTYTALLKTVFLVHTLPAWRPGIGSREVQHEKLHFVDTGLLANMLGVNEMRVAEDDQLTGRLLENFVVMEIVKQLDWADADAGAFHYRQGRDEVDMILEATSGEIAAVEVKARSRVAERDWRAIGKLRDDRRGAFKAGIVIYSGEQTLPLSDRIWAVPVSALWR